MSYAVIRYRCLIFVHKQDFESNDSPSFPCWGKLPGLVDSRPPQWGSLLWVGVCRSAGGPNTKFWASSTVRLSDLLLFPINWTLILGLYSPCLVENLFGGQLPPRKFDLLQLSEGGHPVFVWFLSWKEPLSPYFLLTVHVHHHCEDDWENWDQTRYHPQHSSFSVHVAAISLTGSIWLDHHTWSLCMWALAVI